VLPDVGGAGGLAAFITVALLVTLPRTIDAARQTLWRRK
jgi:hypothetical protein